MNELLDKGYCRICTIISWVEKDILKYQKKISFDISMLISIQRYHLISIIHILWLIRIKGCLRRSWDKWRYLKISYWGKLPDVHRPFGIRNHNPEYAKRLTSGMICVVSLSFDEGMPWTDYACCGSLPPRQRWQMVARHHPSPRSHFQDMKLWRSTEVSTQAYICHILYALNSSILRLSAVEKRLGKW